MIEIGGGVPHKGQDSILEDDSPPEEQENRVVEDFRKILGEVPKSYYWLDEKAHIMKSYTETIQVVYEKGDKEQRVIPLRSETKFLKYSLERLLSQTETEFLKNLIMLDSGLGKFNDDESSAFREKTIGEQLRHFVKIYGNPTEIRFRTETKERVFGNKGWLTKSDYGWFHFSKISKELGSE